MKSILLSIKPKYVELIASGQKTIEVRKTAPQEVPFKCYIYETQGRTETPWIDEDGHFIYKGRGQVIGEFICDKVYPIKIKVVVFLLQTKSKAEQTRLPAKVVFIMTIWLVILATKTVSVGI